MASKNEETQDRPGEHGALVAAEAVAKNAKSTKDREEAAENVVILETTATPTTKTSPSSQKTQWLEQQQQSVSRTLDKTKEKIIKATAEARKELNLQNRKLCLPMRYHYQNLPNQGYEHEHMLSD